MAIPSLAMIPSGYKATKLYSVLPTDGVGDFTVSRPTGGAGTTGNATRTNSVGLLETMGENVPLLDYSDGGCPVLLTQPQSTNFWLNSEGSTPLTSPLGSFGFYDVINDSFTNVLLLENKTVSMSFLIKKTDNSEPIIAGGTTPNADVVVRLGGSSGVSDSFTKKDLGNGYWLAKVEDWLVTTSSTDNRITNNSGDATFVSMIQLEELSYSTSYIKTTGTTITRVADVVGVAGDASTFNSSEGVLYAEIASISEDIVQSSIQLEGSGGKSNNEVVIQHYLGDIRCLVYAGTALIASPTIVSTITDFSKIAIRYSKTNIAVFVNGVKEYNLDGAFADIIGLNKLNFDRSDSNYFEGKTKAIQVFNTELTDAEAITLTTL
jgi:hypothetical protein